MCLHEMWRDRCTGSTAVLYIFANWALFRPTVKGADMYRRRGGFVHRWGLHPRAEPRVWEPCAPLIESQVLCVGADFRCAGAESGGFFGVTRPLRASLVNQAGSQRNIDLSTRYTHYISGAYPRLIFMLQCFLLCRGRVQCNSSINARDRKSLSGTRNFPTVGHGRKSGDRRRGARKV